MEIEIIKENLKRGLALVERITKKVSNLPALRNVLIEGGDNYLKLTTTNLEVSILCWVLAKIKKPGLVLVPATFLLETLNYLGVETLLLTNKENNLSIVGQDHQIQIQGQKPEEFPVIPKMDRSEYFNIPLKGLVEGLGQVVNIPSFSQVRPEISGVYLRAEKDRLKQVATDSFRLAEKIIALPEAAKKEISFILPQGTSQELLNIFTEKEGSLRVYNNPNQILFAFEEEGVALPRIEVLSRLIEGEYPKYQEIFPKKIKTKAVFKRERFLSLIKGAGLFSGKIAEIKFAFKPKESKVYISSQSYDLGKQQSQTEAKLEGEEATVSYNYKFLQDGLQNIKASEVVFSVADGEGPGVLRGVGDATYTYILMPIKSS